MPAEPRNPRLAYRAIRRCRRRRGNPAAGGGTWMDARNAAIGYADALFFLLISAGFMTVIDALTEVLKQRREATADSSYVASLYARGLNKILEKVGEEATETLLAARDLEQQPDADHRQALVAETADLWFHSMVMLVHLDIEPDAVLTELERRFGLSGHTEKARRGATAPDQ